MAALFHLAMDILAKPASAAPADGVCQRPNPVLLVHGIHDSGRSMRRMGEYLAARGWQVKALDLLPNDGAAGIDEMAAQVARFMRDNFPAHQKVDLVGYSMGGLVSRYYVQRLGGLERVGRFVTISAPHNGTWLAWLRNNPACVQMRPDSALLRDLNGDVAMLDRIRFTNLWTPFDLIIVPASSSTLPVGAQRRIPMPLHPLMIHSRACMQAVVESLKL